MTKILLQMILLLTFLACCTFAFRTTSLPLRRLHTSHVSSLQKTSITSLQMLPPPPIIDLSSFLFYQKQPLIAAAVNLPLALLLLVSKNKSLTKMGLLHATSLGIGLWSFLGPEGWLIGVLYFVMGSLATKVKMAEKERLGIAEKRGGARGPENVWGSAATAMTCAMMTYFQPHLATKWKAGFVTAFATKLSDTFGSELGKAYGKTTYLVTSLKRVPKGTEGAVSLEGTIAGIVASCVIAAAAYRLDLLTSLAQILQVILATFIATTMESYIGAIFQDRISWLNNELVNLIMTVLGAAIAIAMFIVTPL
jgi:uncharacterized protein (TIGR00297 family)